MNSKKAEHILGQYGLKLLRWDRTFTQATVSTEEDKETNISTAGGRDKLIERIRDLNAARAEEILQEHSLVVVKWNRPHTVATVRTQDDKVEDLRTDDGPKKLLGRIQRLHTTSLT